MKLTTRIDGTTATIAIEGKLSVATSPDLEDAVHALPEDVTSINMELADLEYISSAGLRVLVASEKSCVARGGRVRLLHPSDEVSDVLDMTGLVDVFAIER